jgi:AraC-like DNA-binding protein
MVSVGAVRALVEVVARAGIASTEFLAAAQLRPEQLNAPDARIPRSTMYLLCERALEVTDDPALGLHWAERPTESTFILISQLIAHAPTLRHGFESMAKFARLLSDEIDYQIYESEDSVTVRAVPLMGASIRVQRFWAETMVAGFCRFLRGFRMSAAPRHVGFAYAAPEYHAEYTKVFEQAVLFAQPFTGIVFDRALLDLPAHHKDRDLYEALRAVAERRLLEVAQLTTFTQRVREYLVRRGGPHRTDMDEAARAVGMSVRSLRRRLTAEGSSYLAVANNALAIVAKHMLISEQYTIQETGYAMGFADARSFHRAFRRWTGVTPGAFRRAQGENFMGVDDAER